MGEHSEEHVLSNVVRIDDDRIRDHLGKIVPRSLDNAHALPTYPQPQQQQARVA